MNLISFQNKSAGTHKSGSGFDPDAVGSSHTVDIVGGPVLLESVVGWAFVATAVYFVAVYAEQRPLPIAQE